MAARFHSDIPMFNRLRASALYLAVTATVATLVFLLMHWLWYPGALFSSAGGRDLFFLISGVDLVLGPLIVLIIYQPGKKGLKFDLAAIGTLQLLALASGIWVLYESRPAYIVFIKDRFELVRANDLADEDLAKVRNGPFAQAPRAGPRVVGALLPKDPNEQFNIGMAAMQGGRDVHLLPQYYVPYDQLKGDVMLKAFPMSRLRELNPSRIAEIDALEKRLGRGDADLRFLPMRSEKEDLAVILDNKSAEVLDTTTLRPWTDK